MRGSLPRANHECTSKMKVADEYIISTSLQSGFLLRLRASAISIASLILDHSLLSPKLS